MGGCGAAGGPVDDGGIVDADMRASGRAVAELEIAMRPFPRRLRLDVPLVKIDRWQLDLELADAAERLEANGICEA